MKRELRPYQTRAIEMLRQSLGSGKLRPVLQAPTGFGKTRLAAAVVEGALAKKKRVIFTVPALSLVDQTVRAFWDDGIRDVGVIQGMNPMTDWSRPVQVASVQTLQRRPFPEADVVLIDECHRWFDFYPKWMRDPRWQSKPFIGLSATPWTRGLGRYFDDLIIAATTQDLISEGYLSPFRVFAPSHPDLTRVRTVAGDYDEGDLSDVMNDALLVADVVDTRTCKAFTSEVR
jgi:DNA repair protein RadD